jgi:hypothetical protein
VPLRAPELEASEVGFAFSGSRSTETTEPTNSSGSTINGPSDEDAPSSDAAITTGASNGNNAMITAVLAAAPRNAAAPTRAARILFGPIAVDNPSETGRRAVAVVDNDGPTLVKTKATAQPNASNPPRGQATYLDLLTRASS